MTSAEFVIKAKNILNYKTLYVNGCFGSPMTEGNKLRYRFNTAYNKKSERQAKIQAASNDTFGFDCVGLIKGILWGWNADLNKTYGGATYASNSVPDISENTLITKCNPSADFTKIVPGAVVWMNGHIGIYIGDNLVIESSPAWSDGVQVTAVANLGGKQGYNKRTWTKWGKLPYIDYQSTALTLKVRYKDRIIEIDDYIVKDSKNYVSIRQILESLGYKVSYDTATKMIVVE